MRIISGTAKGRKLASPPAGDLAIRPTFDRAREALFSILATRVEGCRFLDLFAGTGAVGLEALSRGASMAVFVDYSPHSLALIKKNLAACHRDLPSDAVVRVLRHDLRSHLPTSMTIGKKEERFDLIFADPPYGGSFSTKLPKMIQDAGLLSPTGLLIIEERQGVTLLAQQNGLELVSHRRYGDTAFWFYQQQVHLSDTSHDGLTQ